MSWSDGIVESAPGCSVGIGWKGRRLDLGTSRMNVVRIQLPGVGDWAGVVTVGRNEANKIERRLHGPVY